jgi:ribosome maturation protein Sdo1
MIQNAMKQIQYSVNISKSAKSQVRSYVDKNLFELTLSFL